MRSLRLISLFILLVFCGSGVAFADTAVNVRGRVLLDGEVTSPGDYAVIFIPALGMGTICDEAGYFNIRLSESAPSVKLEFSRIGYDNEYRSVSLSSADVSADGELWLGDVHMRPQTLMLTAAYITPDGMSPSRFLLKKMRENVLRQRKSKPSYSAELQFNFSTHEIPLLAQVLSGGQKGLAKFAASMMGVGALVKYCLENDDISASAELKRNVNKNRSKDYDKIIHKSNPDPLPQNVQKSMFEFVNKVDLFDLLYGEANNWLNSFAEKREFQLEGTYEYGDRLVNVLSYTGRGEMSIKIHIVEQDWGIMKLQIIRKHNEILRAEARDLGDGVYMPVSFIMNPGVSEVSWEQIPAVIQFVQKEKRFKKAGKARLVKILQERYDAKESFNPYLACGFSVKYSHK